MSSQNGTGQLRMLKAERLPIQLRHTRRRPGIARCGASKLIVVGGSYVADVSYSEWNFHRSTEIIDLVENTCRDGPSMHMERESPAVTVVQHRLFVFGGADSRSVEVLDLNRTDHSEFVLLDQVMPQACSDMSVVHKGQIIYLVGGFDVGDSGGSRLLWQFDTRTMTFQVLPAMKYGRIQPAVVNIHDDLIVAGSRSFPSRDERGANSVEIYHIPTRQWSIVTQDAPYIPTPAVAGFACNDDSMFIFGGHWESTQRLVRYSCKTRKWVEYSGVEINRISSRVPTVLMPRQKCFVCLRVTELYRVNIETAFPTDQIYQSADDYITTMQQWHDFALRKGQAHPRRIRLMMSGPYGMGKTSLVRSLLGEPFQETYTSTEGIYIDKRHLGKKYDFSMAFLEWRSLQEEKGEDIFQNQVDDTLEDTLNRDDVESLLPNNTEVSSSNEQGMTSEDASYSHRTKRQKYEKVEENHSLSEKADVPLEPSNIDQVHMTIWDFAGQIHYHNMHQIFFRNNCLYTLVLDLQYDGSGKRQSTEHEMLLDAQKWLNAIVSSAGTAIGLVVVGTHADCLESWEEAEVRLLNLLEILKANVSEIECDEILERASRIVVDNKNRRGVFELKKILKNESERLLNKRTIPLRWLRFLEILESTFPAANHFCVPLSSMQTEAKRVGITDEREFVAALQLFDQLGEIIYLRQDGLRDWIFPQPQLLLHAMKSLLSHTQMPGLKTRQRTQLREEGFLSNDALSALWSRIGFQNQDQLRKVLGACGLCLDLSSGIVVPARLPDREVFLDKLPNESEIVTLTTFSSHLPPSLFAFVFSRLHSECGVAEQQLKLISRSSGCLAIKRDAESGDESFRVILCNKHLLHSIEMRILGRMDTGEVIQPRKLADKCILIVRALHRLAAEQFGHLNLRTSVRTVNECSGRTHEWCIFNTRPNMDHHEEPSLTHTCEFGICHTLVESVRKFSAVPHLKEQGNHDTNRLEDPIVFADVVDAMVESPIPPNPQEREDHIEKLISAEKPLVKWLAKLGQMQVLRHYTASPREIEWIKRIARLYHKLVPALKEHFALLSEAQKMEAIEVFVSHTGVDKDSYAEPLADYLTSNGVQAFLDRKSLPPGGEPNRRMFQALTSCRYLWCVVSKDFVQNWYPMRELLIGYTRYLLEGEHEFCLIMDCFEKEHLRGSWMEQIIGDMTALRLYDKQGNLQSFPTMLPAISHENFVKRFQRIAATRLSDGRVLVPKEGVLEWG